MDHILNSDNPQNPYTTPEGFFDELEDRIWQEVKGDFTNNDKVQAETAAPVANATKTPQHKTSHLRLFIGTVAAIAASFALVFFLHTQSRPQASYTMNDVDQAFNQLSADDQAFMLSVYEEDVFINE